MINLTKKLQILENAFKLMNQRRRAIVEEYYFGHSNVTSEEAFEELISQLEAIEYSAYNKLNLEAGKHGGRNYDRKRTQIKKAARPKLGSFKPYR